MLGKVGFWGNTHRGGLSVAFGPEMLAWLRSQGVCGIDIVVTADRAVILMPDENGLAVTNNGERSTTGFEHIVRTAFKPQCLSIDVDLPVFGLTEMEFIAEEGCLTGYLPSDHELEWPRLDESCATYDAAQVAKETLQARLISLVASGQTSFKDAHRMPMRLRRLLPPGAWAECLSTAKALAGGLVA
jgi:hypothetical protein